MWNAELKKMKTYNSHLEFKPAQLLWLQIEEWWLILLSFFTISWIKENRKVTKYVTSSLLQDSIFASASSETPESGHQQGLTSTLLPACRIRWFWPMGKMEVHSPEAYSLSSIILVQFFIHISVNRTHFISTNFLSKNQERKFALKAGRLAES